MFISDSETAFLRFENENRLFIICFCFLMIVFFCLCLFDLIYCWSMWCDYKVVSFAFLIKILCNTIVCLFAT